MSKTDTPHIYYAMILFYNIYSRMVVKGIASFLEGQGPSFPAPNRTPGTLGGGVPRHTRIKENQTQNLGMQ